MGCTNSPKKESATTPSRESQVEALFTPPAVPMSIAEPEAKMAYLAEHYWDTYKFGDSLLLSNSEVTLRAFTTYAEILLRIPAPQAEQSIEQLLERSFRADSTSFAHFTELFENYFYSPNSPYLNEELYIPALRYIIQNEDIDPIYKLRPKSQLEMALKNRVGTPATNFEYRRKRGGIEQMQSIRSNYTLLYFNNPDCQDCTRVKEYLVASARINELCEMGELTILSIYPDPTVELWEASTYPSIMIDGYDHTQAITSQKLYDLKAIPTLYLLDKEKIVLLKDAPVEAVEYYLTVGL